jgi:hypothetical protein
VLLLLSRYINVGCCQDLEHAPNRNQGNFQSIFITGFERMKKNIKQLVERANLAKCKVPNPLWLLAGPKKLPEADILNIITEGWGNKPVHPSPSTYEKMATSIITMDWLSAEH